METYFGKPTDRKQNSEGRKSRLSKVGGVNSKGDFEQWRHGWDQAENKPARFECGNKERIKAQCPIWIAKTKRWANKNPTTKNTGGERN